MIQLIFCRTLNSQSSASVTMANYAALLRERGIDVSMTLIDKKRSFGEQLRQLDDGKTLLCKINSEDYQLFFPELRILKGEGRWANVILCGPFAALHAEKIMIQEPWVDGIILGYGEQAMIDQCLSLEKDKIIDIKIDGAWRLPDGNWIINWPSQTFPMTELPTPARDIEAREPDMIGNLEFSRGCDNRCYYCHMRAYNELFGVKRTKKTVDQVIADIQRLYALGKRYLIFNDSVFWNGEADTTEVVDLCDRIIMSGMKIYFMVYLSLYRFPNEILLQKMYDAGLIRVFVGVENPNVNVLHKIKEQEYPVHLFEHYREVMTRMNISYHIGFIVFYPFSDMKQVKDSIKYLYSVNKMHRVGILLERVRLIPNTPISIYLDNQHFDAKMLDTAYHYIIKDPLCEKLQTRLLDVFTHELKESYIQAELLCCNLDILVSIMAHECGGIKPIEAQVGLHRKLKQQYGDFIYDFVTKAINDVCSGREIQIDQAFIERYVAFGKALTVSWITLYKAFASCTDVDARDVFPFWQEWMEREGEKWNELYPTTSCL